MVIDQTLKQTTLTNFIPPKGDYETFRDQDHYKAKLKEWGLSSAKEAKKEFWYKDRNYQGLVTIKGYESYGGTAEFNTIVLEFQNGNLTCIHSAYLKEMQQSSFGKESLLTINEKEPAVVGGKKTITAEPSESVIAEDKPTITAVEENIGEPPNKEAAPKQAKAKESKAKKEKAAKLELPTEKVHFTASVKQFALTYNPFNEENDEVVVFEQVQIVDNSPLGIGLGWCSHSKTLKKFELAIGDTLEFDGKVVAKKLAKGKDVDEEFVVDAPVHYKINNPSKIVKK